MKDLDPTNYGGQKKDWKDVMDLLKHLEIKAFRNAKLAILQLANNLVLADICRAPSLDELGAWIWMNPKLGAFKGLQAMGFSPWNSEETSAAVDCVFQHLDSNLEPTGRLLLDLDKLGVLVVEHLACKIIRWKEETTSSRSQGTLKNNAMGSNGHLEFPIPVEGEKGLVEEVMNQ